MSEFDRSMARIAVGAYDDAQDVRKSMLNRVRDVIRKKNEGIPFDEVEEEKEEEDYDAKYEDDNLPDLIEDMRDANRLTDEEFEYMRMMLAAASAAEQVEDRAQNVMKITKSEPVYTEWLQYVYGVSHTLTARLIHRFGYCEDFDRVSNLWSYAGMAPGQDRNRGEQLNYDPKAKTLAWLVADRIIMQGDSSQYKTEFYEPYKKKQIERMELAEDDTCLVCKTESVLDDENDVCKACRRSADGSLPSAPASQGHAHNRAVRYLAKKFLKHYWAITRDIADEPVPDEWVIAHGGHEKREDTFENPFYAKRELMSSEK